MVQNGQLCRLAKIEIAHHSVGYYIINTYYNI